MVSGHSSKQQITESKKKVKQKWLRVVSKQHGTFDMPSTNNLNIAVYLASESSQQKNKSQLLNTDLPPALSTCCSTNFDKFGPQN